MSAQETRAALMLAGSLLILAGCAQNRAKIAYSSPPVTLPVPPASAAPGAPMNRFPVDDAHLTDNLSSVLISDARIRATNVRVSVRNGIVTLQGVLNSGAAKDAATQDCRGRPGVKQVINQISVDPEG